MKKILLVDDKVDIQEILADFLRNSGYKTDCYANGQQAIDRTKGTLYDLIITDLLMPDKDGFTFIKEFKALPSEQNRKTPVIVITGGSPSPDFLDSIDSLKSEGCEVLRKPFTQKQFMDAVQRSFGKRAA